MMFFSPDDRLLDGNKPAVDYGTSSQPGPHNEETFGDTERRRDIEKALLRKLDLRTAFLVLMYIMNYMDRNNVAAARLKGLEEDLRMSGTRFNTLISILYVGYVLMQTPSQIAKPSVYLSGGMSLWGVISFGTGISQRYTRNELGLRMAILICGSSVSNAFGSLVASGILSLMDGALGIPAWRWLFFVEGALTLVISTVALFIIPDFPSSPASWLTHEEHLLARLRMEEDLRDLERDQLRQITRSGG
ncbi:Major facilitator superfamily domain containing protein [Tylopilus felleus]